MQVPEREQALRAFRDLLRVSRKLRRLVRPIFAEWDLTGAQYATLSRIPEQGISLTELAESSSSDPATLSGVVERLTKSGLVTRKRSTSDRRVVVISLTEQGRAVVDAIEPLHEDAVSSVFGKMTPEKLEALGEILDEVERSIEAAMGGP